MRRRAAPDGYALLPQDVAALAGVPLAALNP
jgi:hypothetical protein